MQRHIPSSPKHPEKMSTTPPKNTKQAQSEFEQILNDYTEECEEIRTRSEAGEIILYFRIESKDIVLCYVPKVTCTTNDTKQEQNASPVRSWKSKTNATRKLPLKRL